jgi:hypothetical protein
VNRLRRGRNYASIAAVLALIPLAAAIVTWRSWVGDNELLRERAVSVTAGLSGDAARIRAVNDWAYQDLSDGKNHQFFLLRTLGPTPVQVMARGGDCADKSRLVSAMLDELGIKAGSVMIFPCPHCPPIHTVVEARLRSGSMIVDPIWGVDYPAAKGGFLGRAELAGTSLGRDHIAMLKQQRAANDKIQQMPADEATFDFAKSINWDKNFETKLLAGGLKMMGYDADRLFRPRFLEDPKLALTIVLGSVAVLIPPFGFLVGVLRPQRRHRTGLLARLFSRSLPSAVARD